MIRTIKSMNQNISDTEVLRTYEKVLDLVSDERKLVAVDNKEHQLSVIKTYLWLNITFIAAFAWLYDLLASRGLISMSNTIMLIVALIPGLAGLTLGVIGLSQSVMRIQTSAPLDDFVQVAKDAPAYSIPEYKIIQLEVIIENYQKALKEQCRLVAVRTNLLHWQCRFSLISLYALIFSCFSIFVQLA